MIKEPTRELWFALMRCCISVFSPKTCVLHSIKATLCFWSLFLHEAKWFWDCDFDSYTTKKGCSQHRASRSHLHSNTLLYKCLHKNIVLQGNIRQLEEDLLKFCPRSETQKTLRSPKPLHHLQRETHSHPVVMTKALQISLCFYTFWRNMVLFASAKLAGL